MQDKTMRWLLTGASITAAGFIVALIAPNGSRQYMLALAMIVGWSLGAGVEAAWREADDHEDTPWLRAQDTPWMRFWTAVGERVGPGFVLLIPVLLVAYGLGLLGVGSD